MKYIRTKDAFGKEIIALYDDRPIEKGGNVLKFSQKSIVLRNGIVIKRKDFDNGKFADTIEELCDEFIFVVTFLNDKGYWIVKDYEYAKKGITSYKEDKIEAACYGAIWTEWGLKYIAKFNNKGELELLGKGV